MIIKSTQELAAYQAAADKSTQILRQLFEASKEGVTPLEIDQLADRLCAEAGVIPCFKGVGSKRNAYQYATCISVNETVVHGIPTNEPLKKGDLVKVDFGINDQGLLTDHCFTKAIGEPSPADLQLMKVARKAIQSAARKAVTGNRVGDLGYTMQSIIEAGGASVVKELVGHGIGHTLHDEPQIPGYGRPRSGAILREGMVICVEAQVIAGKDDGIYQEDDGWTIKSYSGRKSAMFEYMVVVGREPLFLTKTWDWALK